MFYYAYNFIIDTDIYFETLSECSILPAGKELVSLLVNEEIDVEPDYTINYVEDIKYYLYPNKSTIIVQTNDLNLLFNSLLGLPMSVYSLLKSNVMLHCNALSFNSGLYCFIGNKEIGKTTLSMYLQRYGSIFSDDNLIMDVDDNGFVWGYGASHTIKLCNDTYDRFFRDGLFDEHLDAISKKAIIPFLNNERRLPIRKLFFVIRGDEITFKFKEVGSPIAKKVLLFQSVFGKDNILKGIVQSFGNTELFKALVEQIPFCIIQVPPIEYYEKEIKTVFEYLQEK